MKYPYLLIVSLIVLIVSFAGCQKDLDNPTAVNSEDFSALDRSGVNENIFAVVTESNSAAGNEIVVYTRNHNGSISLMGSFSTGGLGSGAGLGSQGAVVLSGKFIYAVNAGSADISVLRVDGSSLTLADKESSGGIHPVSLTVHHNLLYVLNAGGEGNITGFRINGGNGTLTQIPGSERPLSGPAAGPAQIEFSPDGRLLVVTEKVTNSIDTYSLNPDGTADGPVVEPSEGNTPFGFEFDNRGHLIVSDAYGGSAGAGAMSSYNVGSGGVNLITGPVTNGQTAPCWVTVTNNGRFTYTTNAGTGNISGYDVHPDGSITLFTDGGSTGSTGTGSSPIDMALSNNSEYLYALGAGTHTISVFRIDNITGALTSVQTVTGLPDFAAGLAAN
jgi:6-phosphogluconolactonase